MHSADGPQMLLGAVGPIDAGNGVCSFGNVDVMTILLFLVSVSFEPDRLRQYDHINIEKTHLSS